MSRIRFSGWLLPTVVLFLIPLLWFAPVVIGGKTLVPADNLYQFQPWASLADETGVGVPHNELLNDLLLENYVWKTFLRQSIAEQELPLWNPYLFSGVPFLAAGQHSALYPLTLVFYVLPLPLAYGVFTWLQLGIAGLGMYLLGRTLRLSWPASLLAGLAYAFSGFLLVSVVFTMIIAAAAWLPWLLACIEIIVRKQEDKGDADYSPVPYLVAGAIALGLGVLAGHPEITVLTLLTAGFYSLWRLIALWRRLGTPRRSLRLGLWMLVMVVAGLALGSIQLIPLLELVSTSFREGSVSYDQVVGWAWPTRQILTFVLPDFFGNPSHHGWFDPWLGGWRAAGPNAFGGAVRDVFWGVKNYVEGGNYLGIISLLLVAFAVLGVVAQTLHARRERSRDSAATGYSNVWLFLALAVLSLLFAFGTPLYALLFYGVPGYKQLHSAFRWVFPYTLSMAVLAGFGLQMLLDRVRLRRTQTSSPSAMPSQPRDVAIRVGASLGAAALAIGLGTLFLALLSLVVVQPFEALGQRIVDSSDLAQAVFASGQDFWSYQWGNVMHMGAFATLTGLWLMLVARLSRSVSGVGMLPTDARADSPEAKAGTRERRLPLLIAGSAIVILLLDQWLVLGTFNPAVDPSLLEPVPESVAFLQEDADLWRMTTFEGPGTTKTFNANTPWLNGLQDARGYDSIIPRQYVAYAEAIEPQGQLLYNRVSPFYDPASLEDPLTDLLGIRYVMSEVSLDVPGWELVYPDPVNPHGESEGVYIYRNQDAFPRAFVATEAQAAPADQVLDLAREVDLRDVVVLEEAEATATALEPTSAPEVAADQQALGPGALPPSGFAGVPSDYDGRMPVHELPAPASPQLRTATVSNYGTRQVFVDLNLSDRGWLVLTDAWFPGWKAYLRAFGETGEGVDPAGNPLEQELPIFRANGNFRAVYIPAAGQWTVRFVYSPRSVLLGVYVSFLAIVSLLLLAGSWAWGRFYREAQGEHTAVRTVAKNSAVQMVLSLLNRAIDFAFAMLRLRVLGPSGEGSYAFAIAIYGFFEILVRFGLGTLLTRDVAQHKDQAGRYLVDVVTLRTLLWLFSLPLLGLVMAGYAGTGNLTTQEAQAIALFGVALFFATLADSFSAVFMAYEKMEYPAAIASTVAVARVALGALVILPPFSWGFVGLAGVSVLMNMVQALWLGIALRRHVPLHITRSDWVLPFRGGQGRTQRKMLRESYPLMLNHLLASVFWRIDLWILRPLAGAAAVGIYSAAVKYLDGINVIPSYFTLAIFPLMSRYAKDSRESLVRAYKVAIRLLVMVALPIAIAVTVLATPLIRILGGAAYLPDSATALRILIWSIPIGFINSVTQYVLIAVGQQRFLTRAFLIGVAFNLAANLIFIPIYGYLAAAVITVLSEFSLLLPFYLAVRKHVAPMPWVELLWRQAVAAAAMVLTVWLLVAWSTWLAVGVGSLVYLVVLLASGTFRDPDLARIWRALPLTGRGSKPAAAGSE